MASPQPSRYPPIRDYAIIGDSRACALISRDGSIDWLCLPDLDSPSVFGRVLDWDRGGYFRIAPACAYTTTRRYIGETNVLETAFSTERGDVRLVDFVPALTEIEKRHALQPLRAVARLLECDRGRVPMRLEYVPRPGYGSGGVSLRARTPFEVTATRGAHVTHLSSDVRMDSTSYDARAAFDIEPGQRLRFSLAYSHAEPAVIISDSYVDDAYDRTIAFWNAWSAQCTYSGAYHEHVVRSALVLKLLSYAPSGAIAAAATTSLPEWYGGQRNWDYRYCWIRDAAFTVRAFLATGFEAEANAFAGWLMHATRQTAPQLRPLYTLHGDPHVPERELMHLEGYRRSSPVRVGNGAEAQRQFDVYGELIDSFHAYVSVRPEPVSHDESAFIAGMADYVAKHWREPDNGIWEPRRPPRHYTHSKVMAWDALAHAAEMAERGVIRGNTGHWRAEAALLREQVLERGFNVEAGTFTQTLDGAELDAAVLTMPLVGFIDGDDPRMISTVDAIQRRLSRNGYLYRYDTADGLPAGEGSFVACNFWLAAAQAATGRVDEACRSFERALTAQNDVGVMGEEIDPDTGDALGNVPQVLSHLALITAAVAIASRIGGDTGSWPLAGHQQAAVNARRGKNGR